MPKTPASKVSQSSYRHKAAPLKKREKSSSDKEKQLEDYIHGFSSDSDSSDASDDGEAFSDEIDIGKLPTISKDDETVKRKLDRAKKQAVSLPRYSYTQVMRIGEYLEGDGPWRHISCANTSWLLRRSDERLLFTIW